MAVHIEARDCGCRIKHERVYVCERHAEMPESIRDRLSEMVSKVMADEINAAVTVERARWAIFYRIAVAARKMLDARKSYMDQLLVDPKTSDELQYALQDRVKDLERAIKVVTESNLWE